MTATDTAAYRRNERTDRIDVLPARSGEAVTHAARRGIIVQVGRPRMTQADGWFFKITLSTPSFAAFANVSYAFITSPRAKRCVTSLPGCNLPDLTTLSSIGVVTVSTSRVVSVMLRSQSFSTCLDERP